MAHLKPGDPEILAQHWNQFFTEEKLDEIHAKILANAGQKMSQGGLITNPVGAKPFSLELSYEPKTSTLTIDTHYTSYGTTDTKHLISTISAQEPYANQRLKAQLGATNGKALETSSRYLQSGRKSRQLLLEKAHEQMAELLGPVIGSEHSR